MAKPTLPTELLALILAKVAEAEDLHERDVQSLARACLVSHTFLALARRQLYASVHLTFVPVDDTGRPLLAVSEDEEDDNVLSVRTVPSEASLKLSRTLKTSAALAASVEIISLDVGRGAGDGGAEMMEEVMQACWGVKELSLRRYMDNGTDSTEALMATIAQFGAGIRIVHVFDLMTSTSSAIDSFISDNASLEELHLLHCTVTSEAGDRATCPSFALRAYTDLYAVRHDITFEEYLSSSHASLRRLHIYGHGTTYNLAPFVNLDSCRYEFHPQAQVTTEEVLSTLGTLSNLRHLTLYSVGKGNEIMAKELAARRLLHHLPALLEVLHIQHVPFPVEYINDFLQSSACPQLRRISLPPTSTAARRSI